MTTKTKLFWPGLFLLLCAWQVLLPWFGPSSWLGVPVLAAGALFMAVAFWDVAAKLSLRNSVYYALVGVLATILAPYPYRLGGILIVIGIVLRLLRQPASKLSSIGFGVVLAGAIWLVQGACLCVLLRIAAVFHGLPFLAPVVASILRFFGCDTAWESNTVFVQASDGIREYAVASEYFGWVFLFNALVGVAIWQLLGGFKRPLRNSLQFLVAALVYALVRYVLLALLYLDLPALQMFWKSWLVCVSFLPLFMFFTAAAWRTSNPTEPSKHEQLGVSMRTAFGGLAAALAVLSFVAAWGWEEPGRRKPGRVLVDETHSAWELMNRKYDTEWYGEESGYNYYCLAQFLGRYYDVGYNRAKITPELLCKYDLLLIKTPTSSFSSDEIDAIEQFVRRGGGLLLIGDHTNVFGTSTYLNPIARRFGLHYNADATYDLPTGGLTLYRRPRLLPHPIVQWLPPFLFGTSCTLDVPPGAAIPMIGYALRVGGHDYSTPSFFTSKNDGPHVGFGMFPQLGAVKAGRGRVAAFTDSTVFSNFWMFLPGKPELLLGCTEWLNSANRYAHWTLWLALLTVFLGGTAGVMLRKGFGSHFALLLAAGSLGFFAGTGLISALNRAAYAFPSERAPCPTIYFDREYSRFELPDTLLIHEPNVDFHTFYTWAQRVGYEPRACSHLDQCLQHADGLVMINPSGQISKKAFGRLKSYVESGGVLFVLGSSTNSNSCANAILSAFGTAFTNTIAPEQPIVDKTGKVVALNRKTSPTSGGEGVLFTQARQPVLSLKRAGNGTIIFSADAELFSNASLGSTGTMPNEMQMRLYRVIFELFRQVDDAKGPRTSRELHSAPAS